MGVKLYKNILQYLITRAVRMVRLTKKAVNFLLSKALFPRYCGVILYSSPHVPVVSNSSIISGRMSIPVLVAVTPIKNVARDNPT